MNFYKNDTLPVKVRKIASSVSFAALIFSSAVCVANAQSNVLAKVGDLEITQEELDFVAQDMAQQFARVPEDQRKAATLSAVIDIKLLSLLAAKEGVDQSEAFKTRLEFLKARTLHNMFFQQRIAPKVDEDAVKARYEIEVKGMEQEKQINARHILVKTEEEAVAIIAEIEAGKDFVEAAKEKSTGPSGPNGGDLGFFGKGQMVPEFEAAAFALEKGGVTKKPIKTQFGWHIIKKEDERDAPLPTLDASRNQIRQFLLQENYLTSVADARKIAEVTIVDEALEAQVKALKSK